MGITGALANIRAPPSPINRSKGNGKAASSSSSSSNSTSVIPATEDEGAADVIYILSLADVIANFQKKLPIDSDPTEASMEKFPEAILNALSSLLSSDRNMVNCVLEVTSQRPVRAGWVNPAQPLLDIQAGIGYVVKMKKKKLKQSTSAILSINKKQDRCCCLEKLFFFCCFFNNVSSRLLFFFDSFFSNSITKPK